MRKKGWPQGLDNGVMSRPKEGQTHSMERGHSMDFSKVYGVGENEHGQVTLAPGQVVSGGKAIYDQQDYPKNTSSTRWSPKKR